MSEHTSELRLADDFTLPRDVATKRLSVLAQSGAGKTYLAAVLVEELLASGQPTVVIDPLGVWWGLRASADGAYPGLPIIVIGGDHGDLPLDLHAGAALAELVATERLSLVLDLADFRKGQQTQFMTAFCETLYHRNRQPLHLVVDEADAFAPQRPQKGEERLLGAMEDLRRRARARGIGSTLITQRPAVLNKNVLTQTDLLITMRMAAPQDQEAIDDWVRGHGTREQRDELLASLAGLPTGTAWFWSPGWLKVFRQVAIRQRHTFDSSATPEVGQEVLYPQALASVDLDRLRALLTTASDEAAANDVPALRARIAALERELRERPHLTPERITERVEVPIIAPALVARLAAVDEAVQTLLAALHGWRDELVAAAAITEATPPAPVSTLPPTPAPPPSPVVAAAPPARLALVPPQRRILDALAEFAALGLTEVARANVATWSGQSPKSSAFDAHLRALRDAELVASMGQAVTLLPAGHRLALCHQRPPTLAALHESWQRRLLAPQARMVAVIVHDHPTQASREYLALSSRQSVTSSAFDGHLRALRDLGLVTWQRGGLIGATALLFPPGLT